MTIKDKNLNTKFFNLQSIISKMESAVVAFSGGIDSTLVAKTALLTLGPNNTIAVTADSFSIPRDELSDAKKLAKTLKLNHKIVLTNEFSNNNYLENTPNRCFLCKEELYSHLKTIATNLNIKHIINGHNLDDKNDFRPGMKSAKTQGIRSPLIEASLSKEEIRKISKEIKLPNWNKPAQACLSSRIPYGEKISPEQLKRIEKAEKFLKTLELGTLRMRSHGNLARIEVNEDKINQLIKKNTKKKILNFLHSLGYIYVTIDLEGFRSGSLNETFRKL
ncbi:MAG: ATP-dependent sacrificial sulfur transferase LarE [SAR202 cluster bacterium]|nr:ATP-dependent sacrificial sulfur transferase LarE [SAR202 cluster bacterium]|tara:strand:- start:16683 stop:17513 length:831 start_codon:yes stop_codon:yes gene_type:complete